MTTFEAGWRARFERLGRTYVDEHAVSGWSAEGLARRVRTFERLVGELPLPERASVLELGCGAGTHVRHLAGLGHVVVGLDYSLPTLRRAVAADPGAKAQYVLAEGYELPFGREAFDLVVCIGVLQAVDRPEALLDEIARVMRPGALVIVEALNALEVPAVGRRIVETLTRRPPRVRTHPPHRLRRWLEARAFEGLRSVPVYVPPRHAPGLGRLLDRPGFLRALHATPGGWLLVAHGVWQVGRKVS